MRDGIISFALIENNVIYENGASTAAPRINVDGVDDSVIRNNLLYNNHAFGISLFSDGRLPRLQPEQGLQQHDRDGHGRPLVP